MSDERAMIPSEATTAGLVRQSAEDKERCPECNSPRAKTYVDGAVAYGCGSVYRANGDPEHMGDKCPYLRAEWLEERERAALAREARLRRVVEGVEWVWFDATGDGGTLCPYCKNSKAAGHASWCIIAAALSSSPANPYASVVEAARQDYSSARTACEYRRVKGDCEAWTRRGRTCPDCPLEWFDALPEALGKLDEEADACDS